MVAMAELIDRHPNEIQPRTTATAPVRSARPHVVTHEAIEFHRRRAHEIRRATWRASAEHLVRALRRLFVR